jgi:hypothetical protein
VDVRYPGALTALAAGLLALGGGCVTVDKPQAEPKRPDVTQPGVLPPPQEMLKPAASVAPGGAILQASAAQPQPAPSGLAAVPGVASLAKFAGRGEKRIPATDMAVGWQPRIAQLPDPARHGAMGSGLVGQMFLFGGPHLQFVEANGTLTVDLIDDSPRPAGQPAAKPERWQFTKETLRKLKTVDETFGKSYVLFLPWPAYKPDITRVRISARYDPEFGDTLYASPSVITIDTSAPFGTPVWEKVDTPSDANRTGTNWRNLDPTPLGDLKPPAGTRPDAPAPIPLPARTPGGASPPSLPADLPPIVITPGRP